MLYNQWLTFLVGAFDVLDLLVGTSAEDLNQHRLIRAGAFHGFAKALSIIESLGFHESKYQALQITGELRLQLTNEILGREEERKQRTIFNTFSVHFTHIAFSFPPSSTFSSL